MDIGLLLHTRQILRQEEAARSFEQLWEDAAQAEQLGFDHIWLGDSVTVLDKARGDCLTTMAALAARTSKIKIGAVPMLPALRNPVLLAHALATLDVISKGRIILGVSVGPVRDYIQRQFAACGAVFPQAALDVTLRSAITPRRNRKTVFAAGGLVRGNRAIGRATVQGRTHEPGVGTRGGVESAQLLAGGRRVRGRGARRVQDHSV